MFIREPPQLSVTSGQLEETNIEKLFPKSDTRFKSFIILLFAIFVRKKTIIMNRKFQTIKPNYGDTTS